MNEQLYHFNEELASTNTKAKELITGGHVKEGLMIQTAYQTHGRGQLDAVWESRKGKNLLVSIVIKPAFLPIEKQFYLNRVAALAVSDFLCLNIADEIAIKWPNDILANDEKISGILIENSIQGNKIEHSIVGIGININQTKFSPYTPPATSLYNLTYREYDIKQCAEIFYKCFMNRYKQLKDGMNKILLIDFNQLLYRKGVIAKYIINSKQMMAKICEVKDSGVLVVEDEFKNIYELRTKEIKYLFN